MVESVYPETCVSKPDLTAEDEAESVENLLELHVESVADYSKQIL